MLSSSLGVALYQASMPAVERRSGPSAKGSDLSAGPIPGALIVWPA
jgi:hypothetical protein